MIARSSDPLALELVPGTGRVELPSRAPRPLAAIRADLERVELRVAAVCDDLERIDLAVRALPFEQRAELASRLRARGLL